jgi:hypothetical protein
MWPDAVLAARLVIESRLTLTEREADELAEAVAERLLGDFLTEAEADSTVVFGMDGTGPYCSWCGRMPGPRLHAGHSQYGVFCDCKRADDAVPAAEAVAASAEAAGLVTP